MSKSAAGVFKPVPVPGHARRWFAILLAGLTLPILYVTYLQLRTPEIRYVVGDGTLSIEAKLGSSEQSKKLDLGRISEVRPEWLRGGALKFGTDKPGYCVGFYDYPSLGEVWQVTDCSDLAVLLRTASETTPVVVTPTDRDGFMRTVTAAGRGVFLPPGKRASSYWVTLVVILAVYGLVVLALVTVLFIAPTRLAYRVRSGHLEVTTLVGKRLIPLTGATVRRHRPLLGERLSGFLMPGYLVGTALYDNMATTVLASLPEEGVMVEADGRYFLSPANPDALVAALLDGGAVPAPKPAVRTR
jgi:hypothetical protein